VGLGDQTIEEAETARDLLAYLIDNPDAQDTLEGIVEWWLLERKIESRIANVKKVLEELMAKGLILERKGSDSRVRYLINNDRRDEILALLKQAAD
jgi:hypothetical protein